MNRLKGDIRKSGKENRGLLEKLRDVTAGGDGFAAIYFPYVDGKHWMTIRHFPPSNPKEEPSTLRNIRITVASFDPTNIAHYAP
jgi:hypothetical protein